MQFKHSCLGLHHEPITFITWVSLSIHNTQNGNHFIPNGTTAMVNMRAITHDQDVWSELEQFKPECFMKDEDVPIIGFDLRLALFGFGRRVCPRKAMGLATVELWLAMFLQNFKWMPCDSGFGSSECLKLFVEMKCSLITKVVTRSAFVACVN